jgi:hypothetical protein
VITLNDMLERYDRRCAAPRFYLDPKSFNAVIESLRLRPERSPAKVRFDDINIYPLTAWDQERASFNTDLANSGESATYKWDEWDGGTTATERDESVIRTEWDEWDRGVTVMETFHSPPSGAYMASELRGRQQAHFRQERVINLTSTQRRQTTLRDHERTPTLSQQPTVPHLDKEEPKDSFVNATGTMILITGGLALGGWLGLKAFRAIGKLVSEN